MKKLMVTAFASAIALAFSAVAGTQVSWFNGGIGADWPNDSTMSGGAWTTSTEGDPADLVVDYTEASGIELDAGDDQLQFTNGVQRVLGTGTDSVTYTSQMQLYPFTSVPTSVESDAKAGVILVTTDSSTYVYGVRKQDGVDANEWFKLSDTAVDATAMATVTITAAKSGDNALAVTYTYAVGDTVAADAVAATVYVADYTLTKASYTGSGYVKSLSANAIAQTKTFTIDAEALAASNLTVVAVAGATGPDAQGNYTIAWGNDATFTFGPTSGYVISSDANTATYKYADITDGSAISIFGSVEAQKGKAHIEGGAYYLSLNAAVNGATAGQTIVLDENITDAGYNIAKALTIDLNGKTLTFNGAYDGENSYAAKSTAALTITSSVEGAKVVCSDTTLEGVLRAFAALTINNVEIDGTALAGDEAHTVRSISGVLTISGSTSIKGPTKGTTSNFAIECYCHCASYPSETKPRSLVLNTTGTIEGDILLACESFTYTQGTVDGRFFGGAGYAGAWADANDVNDYFAARVGSLPTAEETTYYRSVTCELFPTLEGALTSTEEAYGSTVTLVKAVTLDKDLTVGKTLDLNALNLTIPTGKTLTLNGTLKCNTDGFNFINLGSMTLSSSSVVYMGDAKMFGTTDGKFSISSGTVAQTAIDGDPTKGMQYTISASGAAAMTGDFVLYSEDPVVYNNDTFYLDTGATFTLSADASEEQAAICIKAKNSETEEITHTGYVYTTQAKATGLTFTLAATGITGTPTYKIGDNEPANFTASSGKWVATGLAENTVLIVNYTADSSFTTPGEVWAVKPGSGATRDGAKFTLASANAEVTLTVYDQGNKETAEATAKSAIDAAAATEGCDATAVTKIDTVINEIGAVKVANWVSGNSGVTYSAIAAADKEDAEVSCLVGATAVVTDPKVTLTSIDSTSTAGAFNIKVKLTSGSGTDALKYATDAVKELFQATYSLGTDVDWKSENVTVEAATGSDENEATFKATVVDDDAPAAFIRLKIK